MDQCFIIPEPKIEDAVPAVAAPARKKKQKGQRVENLKGFPSKPKDHPISKEELDSLFPEGWKELPPETYQRLCLIPQKFYVEDHTVHVYCSRKNTK